MMRASGSIGYAADHFGDFGDYITKKTDKFAVSEPYGYKTEKTDHFAVSEPALITQLEVLLWHLGGAERIDPHHEDNDSSVGKFLMFAVKDGLENYGLLPNIRRIPQREY